MNIENKRMKELAGLTEEKLYMTADIGQSVQSLIFQPTDMSKLKKAISAAETLEFKYDIYAEGYGYWEDANGDAIFISTMLVKVKGNKIYADPEHNGKLEVIKPLSGAKLNLMLFRQG